MEWYELLKGQRGELKRLMKEEGVKGRYARIEIDLATASTNGLLEVSGDYIGVASVIGDGTCKVRLDHRHAQQIDLREVEEVMSPFGKIYFTTDGAGGTLVLYIGGALTARLKPIQSKVSLRSVTGTDIDPVQDKRFKAHTFGMIGLVEQTTADVAQPLNATSLKVRWAIIEINTNVTEMGDSTLDPQDGTPIHGQKYTVGSYIAVEHVDLNDVYICNYTGTEKVKYSVTYALEA